jgi:hypothetical protein
MAETILFKFEYLVKVRTEVEQKTSGEKSRKQGRVLHLEDIF